MELEHVPGRQPHVRRSLLSDVGCLYHMRTARHSVTTSSVRICPAPGFVSLLLQKPARPKDCTCVLRSVCYFCEHAILKFRKCKGSCTQTNKQATRTHLAFVKNRTIVQKLLLRRQEITYVAVSGHLRLSKKAGFASRLLPPCSPSGE